MAGLDASTNRGKVKLVACYGASLKMDDAPVEDAFGNPIQRPYASELASVLSGRTGRFRPSSVDGIAGISWVDELSGRLTGFDVTDEKELNPLDWVYQSELGPAWIDALKEPDFKQRRRAMDAILDEAHVRLGKTALERRIVGKKAKKRFAVV